MGLITYRDFNIDEARKCKRSIRLILPNFCICANI